MSMRRKIQMGGSLNREKDILTPSPPDSLCDYFKERFIGWGMWNERRAVCDLDNANITCDYRYMAKDQTPICMRYWYGPKYEIVDELDVPPLVQKRTETGELLYFEDDMTTETTIPTTHPIMLLLSEVRPVPYIQNTMVTDKDGKIVPTHPEFYSKQYVDTHQKTYGINGNQMDWFYDV